MCRSWKENTHTCWEAPPGPGRHWLWTSRSRNVPGWNLYKSWTPLLWRPLPLEYGKGRIEILFCAAGTEDPDPDQLSGWKKRERNGGDSIFELWSKCSIYNPPDNDTTLINGLLLSASADTHTVKQYYDPQRKKHCEYNLSKLNQTILWCVSLCPHLGSTKSEIGKILLPWEKWLI